VRAVYYRILSRQDRLLHSFPVTMGLRKPFGLLAMLTMANLAFAGSDLVCAKHSDGHHAAAESPMPGTDHHDGTSSEKDPCNIPSRADCCQAVTSCAPSLSLAAVVTSFDMLADHSQRPRSIDEVPLTRLIPPDPPPPKD
jgi:hypothetical protein